MKIIVATLCACLAVSGCMKSGPSVSRSVPQPFLSAPSHSMSAQIGAALNEERQARGLHMLSYNRKLNAAALAHARDMSANRYFSHKSQNGTTHFRRVTRQGYDACLAAENIARGQRSVGHVMQGWMESPGHRRNNLLRNAFEYGAAYVEDGNYWVLVLAKHCDT